MVWRGARPRVPLSSSEAPYSPNNDPSSQHTPGTHLRGSVSEQAPGVQMCKIKHFSPKLYQKLFFIGQAMKVNSQVPLSPLFESLPPWVYFSFFLKFDSYYDLSWNKGSWHTKQLSKEGRQFSEKLKHRFPWKCMEFSLSEKEIVLLWLLNDCWFIQIKIHLFQHVHKRKSRFLALKVVWGSLLWSKITSCPLGWDSHARYQENT